MQLDHNCLIILLNWVAIVLVVNCLVSLRVIYDAHGQASKTTLLKKRKKNKKN